MAWITRDRLCFRGRNGLDKVLKLELREYRYNEKYKLDEPHWVGSCVVFGRWSNDLGSIVGRRQRSRKKLDEATGLKLEANTPAKLAKVIQLCEQAISDGLDDENKEVAKQFLSASAIQRAKLLAEQIQRLNNPNQLRRLRNEIVADIKKALDADPNSAEAQMLKAL